jgi:hypothetical protein
MAGEGEGWPTPTLTPVGRGGRAAALVATGLLTGILALVGISLVDQSGGGPGSQAAVSRPTATVNATAAAAARPIVTPARTSMPEPSGGTPPPRVAVSVGPVRTCPPGSTPDVPGPSQQARPPTSVVSMAFDRASARIVLLGRRGESGPAETWTFDVCTNVWTRMHPEKEPDYQAFGMLAYDAAADRTITFQESVSGATSRVWAYDFASDTWTESAGVPKVDGPVSPAYGPVRLTYDPVGGGVVALRLSSPRLMLLYDAKADAWQPIAQDRYPFDDEYPFHILLAYDASVDRLVGYQLGEVRLFDIRTGTWSAPGSPSPPFWYGGYFSYGGEIAYDEAAQRTILFGSGIVIAYDAAADRWGTLYGTPSEGALDACAGRRECRLNHSMVYDPVNERFIVYGGRVLSAADPDARSDDVLAFDTRSRDWTILLAASDGQTAQP